MDEIYKIHTEKLEHFSKELEEMINSFKLMQNSMNTLPKPEEWEVYKKRIIKLEKKSENEKVTNQTHEEFDFIVEILKEIGINKNNYKTEFAFRLIEYFKSISIFQKTISELNDKKDNELKKVISEIREKQQYNDDNISDLMKKYKDIDVLNSNLDNFKVKFAQIEINIKEIEAKQNNNDSVMTENLMRFEKIDDQVISLQNCLTDISNTIKSYDIEKFRNLNSSLNEMAKEVESIKSRLDRQFISQSEMDIVIIEIKNTISLIQNQNITKEEFNKTVVQYNTLLYNLKNILLESIEELAKRIDLKMNDIDKNIDKKISNIIERNNGKDSKISITK